jgi:hypothetical protein
MMQADTSKWSGEGTFTQLLVDRLQQLEPLELVRVEDAPASRSEADYNFISNEIFVQFATTSHAERSTRFGFLPTTRMVTEKRMDIQRLEQLLAAVSEVGPADYSDEGMIQYLRTERIIPPYQTRGYKLVELVRIYEIGRAPARP